MADNPADKNEQKPQPKIFKVYGREFDIATDEGLKQAQTWSEAMSTLVGKQSNEIGQLRDEVEPVRKYNLKNATADEIGLRKQVAELRAAGNDIDADNLLFEFGRQNRIAAQVELERERMWNDYRNSRSDIFDALPEDMAKSYIFSNYQAELEKADDPFSLMDRVLKPKATKLKPKSASADSQVSAPAPSAPAAVLGAGSPPDKKAVESKPDESSPMDKVLEEFGFKRNK